MRQNDIKHVVDGSETVLNNRVCCFSTTAHITSAFYTFEGLHTDFYHVLNITLEQQWTLWRALSPPFVPTNHLPCPSHKRLTRRNPSRSKWITSVANSKQTYVETTGLLMTVKVEALLRRVRFCCRLKHRAKNNFMLHRGKKTSLYIYIYILKNNTHTLLWGMEEGWWKTWSIK